MSLRHNVLVAKCLACKMSGCQNVSPSKCQSVEMLRCQKWVVCKMSGAEMSENPPGHQEARGNLQGRGQGDFVRVTLSGPRASVSSPDSATLGRELELLWPGVSRQAERRRQGGGSRQPTMGGRDQKSRRDMIRGQIVRLSSEAE